MKCKNCTNETDSTSGLCEECIQQQHIGKEKKKLGKVIMPIIGELGISHMTKCNLCGEEIEDSEDRCQDCFEEWGNQYPDRV